MTRFLIALLSLCLFSGAGFAYCAGTDLRAGLSAQDRAELKRLTQAAPYATGNHWRATRGRQELHLVGTVHVHDPRLDPVMDRLRPLVARATTVAVELEPTDEADMQRRITTDPGAVFIMDGPTLPDLMTEAEWRVVKVEAEARGIPAVLAAKMQPWFLMVTLSMPPCVIASEKAGQTGLDHKIMRAAEAAGVPMVSLDTPADLLALLSQDPMEDQLKSARMWLPMLHKGEDMNATTLDIYFEERSLEVIHFSRLLAYEMRMLTPAEVDAIFETDLAVLVAGRNRAWLDKITALPDGLSVVAVGAAHLPGEAGLLNLLAAEGYEIERQPF